MNYDEEERKLIARFTKKTGRPEWMTGGNEVDPATRQVSYHVTPPCPVDY